MAKLTPAQVSYASGAPPLDILGVEEPSPSPSRSQSSARVSHARATCRRAIAARARLLLAVLITALASGGAAWGVGRVHDPAGFRCFGAASHDPAHPCRNPRLRLIVTPSPSEALIETDEPCQRLPTSVSDASCWFGVPQSQAVRTVALLGDSHATHFRAALSVVARALRWQIISLTRSSCPFSFAVQVPPNGHGDQPCNAYSHALVTWLEGQRQISAVVLSDHPGSPVMAPGQSSMDANVAGVQAALRALPARIAHIISIRDDPYTFPRTFACVTASIVQRRNAGQRCRMALGALHPDPDVIAIARLHTSRADVVDLSRFFCDRRGCPPVIGGVLVYRDLYAHLTRTYSSTLGPYLLAAVRSLAAGWRS